MDRKHRSAGAGVEVDRSVDPVMVLVVDDSDVARRVLSNVVAETEGFALVGCACSGEEGLSLLPRLNPDLILLDVHMPGIGGAETARRVPQLRPETVVVLVSADADLLQEAVELSEAPGSLLKRDVSSESLAGVWAEARAHAAEARSRAQALREEAQALKAQARHQTRRAARAKPKGDVEPGES